jgi:RHS repeat-associated protein
MLNNRTGGTLHNNFGYQSKEMQEAEFNDGSGIQQIDFGARYYDHQLGVWHNQDPAGQFPSPYMAMGNSWVNGTDPNGQLFLVDDIIVAAVGFTVGFLQYGISDHFTHIGKALESGAIDAGIAEVGYLTLGGGLAGGAAGAADNASTAALSSGLSCAASYAATSSFTFAQNYQQITDASPSQKVGLLAGYSATSAISAGFNSNPTQNFIDGKLGINPR